MKQKTKQRWQRAGVWILIFGFVFGSIAIYLVGIFGTPASESNPAYTPPALNTLPDAQQQQAQPTTAPAP